MMMSNKSEHTICTSPGFKAQVAPLDVSSAVYPELHVHLLSPNPVKAQAALDGQIKFAPDVQLSMTHSTPSAMNLYPALHEQSPL